MDLATQASTRTLGTAGKLGLLLGLYFSQGLPFGFFTQAVPVIMRQEDYSLGVIGLSSLLALPWGLKFLWAPLIDGVSRRRRVLIPLQVLTILTALGLSSLDPRAGIAVVVIAVLLTNLTAATQDIATDGLAVDLLTHEERGLGNGLQVAGYRVGMIAGGAGLLYLYGSSGWSLTFVVMAGALALATVPVLLYDEPPRASVPTARRAFSETIAGIWRPGMLPWLSVLLLYKSFDVLGSAMLRPLLVDLGVTTEDIAWLVGGVGSVTGLLGAVAGGALINRLGRARSLLVFGLMQAAAVALYALPASGATATSVLAGAISLDHFAGGMATAALFTLMMDACRPDTAASDYTLQASVVVLATMGAASASGFVAEGLGYPVHFVTAGVLTVVGTLAATALLARDRGRLFEALP